MPFGRMCQHAVVRTRQGEYHGPSMSPAPAQTRRAYLLPPGLLGLSQIPGELRSVGGVGRQAWGWEMNGFISLTGEEGDGPWGLQNITSWQKYFEKQEIPGKQ